MNNPAPPAVNSPPIDHGAPNLPRSGAGAPSSENLVGARVRRTEDPRILTGRTKYIDDVVVAGMLEAAVLRSPHPNARIVRIDTTKARELPGVFDVLIGEDVEALCDTQPVIWQMIPDQFIPEHYAMATDQVRWVGQPVVAVAAADRYIAEDALELIDVEYEILPAAGDLDTALDPDGPQVWEGHSNVSGVTTVPKGDAAAAFAEAEVIVKTTLDYGRQMGTPLETRGVVSTWDPITDELDIWMSSQAPNLARDLLGDVLGISIEKIRVRVPDVGGGFGNKFDFYGEEIIASLLSKKTGRPVKLIEDRAESFVATVHSRNQRLDVELAATRDGKITAIRGTVYQVLGAVLGTVGVGPAWAATAIMTGPYAIPNAEVTLKAVLTNRPPYGSYRGWGQPKGCFAHERLIELLAREIGLPANEVRRRNLITEFPYFSQVFLFDSGDYQRCLELAEEAVAEQGWNQIVKDARAQGRSVGIGFGFHVEITAFGPSRIMNAAGLQHATFDEEVVRMDSTGGVTVFTGQIGMGQGVQTAIAQVTAQTLGVPLDTVTVVQGDTDSCPYTGYGTGASRGAAMGGATAMAAATELRTKILRVAGHMLEASPEDLVVSDGTVSIKGAPSRSVTMREIGDASYRRLLGKLPESESPVLEGRVVFEPENVAFSNGCSAALMEVDVATGRANTLGYIVAHDCGVVINPMMVDGQVHGGAAQGIGGALYEELVYDEGYPQVSSLFDYLLPSAADLPRVHTKHLETPAGAIPGGFKGVGECGTIGAASAICAAIEDALPDHNITLTRIPVTPPRLRQAIVHAEGH